MKNIASINIIKMDQVIKAVEAAKKNSVIKRMVIFGSAVGDFCTEDSDIDICVDIEGSIESMAYYNAAREIRKACEDNCDLLVMNRLNDKMKKEIIKKGIEVYVS